MATYDKMADVHCMLDTQGYKYTQSGSVILIAFLHQQWLQESTSVLRYTYTACLFYSTVSSPERGHPGCPWSRQKDIRILPQIRLQSLPST